jgi:ABC-type multidrug transport system permease subunit
MAVTRALNHPLVQIFLARLKEFYREPEALFWVYGFPLLLAIGLGIAFWDREPEPPRVDVQGAPGSAPAEELAGQLRAGKLPVEIHEKAECERRLRTGKTALYIVPLDEGYSYIYDRARPESELARYRVDADIVRWRTGTAVNWQTTPEPVTEPGSRYIDFLIPGLMGLNLMGGGLWGIGFVIVDMRVRKLLKRLVATPMRRGHFLLAMLGARLVLLVPDMLVLLGFGWLVFRVPVRGDLLTLCLVILAGAAAFTGMGLALASRTEKTETISGLINLVMLPMWMVSGTFFSSKRFPDVAQPFIQALPLTHLNDALREVMLEGATLYQVKWRLVILLLWAAVPFAVALKWFRWR